MNRYLEDRLKKLKDFTKDCREDMHEPDECGISADVIGTKLDNAFGEEVNEHHLEEGYQELVIILRKDDEGFYKINLATLIALARKANLED